MKKLIILLLLILPMLAFSETAGVKNIANAPTSTNMIAVFSNQSSAYTGTSYDLGFVTSAHTWQQVISGTPSAVSVAIQGSIDNSNWFDLDTSTSTTSAMRHIVNKPVRYIRGKLTTFTNGTSMSVKSTHGGN